MLFACVYMPDIAIQSILAAKPELRKEALALGEGTPPLVKVVAVNRKAAEAGVEVGHTKAQAEIAGVNVILRSPELEDAAHASLLAMARDFSPRVQDRCADTVVLDIEGLERLFGSPEQIATKVHTSLARQYLHVNVAVAKNPDTAAIAARGFDGISIIKSPEQLAVLPLTVLNPASELLETTKLWGITTLGQLAALDPIALSERLGDEGILLQKLARGQQVNPFVADNLEVQFNERAELEYPVDLLDSLSFVMESLVERICVGLKEYSLSTNEVHLELGLDPPRVAGEELPEEQLFHRRTIKLPNPTADHNLLLRLLEVDLKSHPPNAPVMKVSLRAEAVRPRQMQQGLFAPNAPDPDKLELTIARLVSLAGEGQVGSPELLDTHRPCGFVMARFIPPEPLQSKPDRRTSVPKMALRLFEPPKRASIRLRSDVPVQVSFEGKRGEVLNHSGPWLASGDWWNEMEWSRKEWDVQLQFPDGATQDYRIFLDLCTRQGFLEGSYD